MLQHARFITQRFTLVIACSVAALTTVVVHAQTAKQILDKRVETFTADLHAYISYWADADQLVVQVSVPTDGERDRVAIFDFAKKSISFIPGETRLLTYNRDTRSFIVGHSVCNDPSLAQNCEGHYVELVREVRVEPNAQIVEVRRFGPGTPPPNPYAYYPKQGLFNPLGSYQDGYLLADTDPGKTFLEQDQALLERDEGIPTTWIRPGKEPLRLALRYDEETDATIQYLPFLDKFLLRDHDTSGSSDTNSHLRSVWKRPYEYTPFRLLSRDGTIEEIPYPRFVFDYGIANPTWQEGHGTNFSQFMLTPAGIVIQKIRESGSTFYLFQHDQLYRLTGGGTVLGHQLSPLPSVNIFTLTQSPDGCKIAIEHPKPGFLHSGARGLYLTIIDVCGEGKRQ